MTAVMDAPPLDDSVSFLDEVPESGNPVSSADLTCEVCGTGIPYAGRGRKPSRCDVHKRGGGKSSSRRTASTVVVDRAISELSMIYGVVGQGLKFVHPIGGEATFNARDKLAESYRLLLETDARFRKLFADVESKAAWLPILAVHGELIASVMIASSLDKQNRRAAQTVADAEFGDDV